MNAPELLELLESRGAHVEAHGARLRVNAPRGVLGDLTSELARFKPALLELLGARGAVLLDQNGEEVVIPTGVDADFRAWHWTACGAPFSWGFYTDWEQFARIHCSTAGGAVSLHHVDLATVALAIEGSRREDAAFHIDRARLPWRVAEHLAGRAFDSPGCSHGRVAFWRIPHEHSP